MATKQEIIDIINDGHYLVAAGTNTYTATATPTLRAYKTGKPFYVKFTNANTGSSTLNVDGLGAKNILKTASRGLGTGDIPAGSILEVSYTGTFFQVIGGALLFLTIDQVINSSAGNYAQSII